MTMHVETSAFGSPFEVHVPKGVAVFPSIYHPATFPRGENPRYGMSVVWDHPEFFPGLLQRSNPLRSYVYFKSLSRPPVHIQGKSIQWLVAELAGYEALNIPKDRIFEDHALDLIVQPYKWEWNKQFGVGYRLLSVTLLVRD